jgi:hypothetical protein
MRRAVSPTLVDVRSSTAKYTNRNDTIEIHTNEEGESTTTKVFKTPAVHYAPKFATVLQLPGLKSIELTNVSRLTLRIFNGWLRSSWLLDVSKNKLPAYLQAKEPNWVLLNEDLLGESLLRPRPLRVSGTEEVLSQLVDTFIFAETYDIPYLRQDAVDRLVWCFQRPETIHRSIQTVGRAYTHTQPGSPLRRVLVDGFCFQANVQSQIMLRRMPSDFLVDVVLVQRSLLNKTALKQMPDACEYHEHETEEARKSCESRIFPREP